MTCVRLQVLENARAKEKMQSTEIVRLCTFLLDTSLITVFYIVLSLAVIICTRRILYNY